MLHPHLTLLSRPLLLALISARLPFLLCYTDAPLRGYLAGPLRLQRDIRRFLHEAPRVCQTEVGYAAGSA